VRIISGILRGKQIRPPGNFKARPTTDFAKESLFNILVHQYNIEEMDVLDLFSGTGSISYEFASRGARSVLAIEMAPLHFKFIQESCRNMDLDQVTVLRADAFRFLKKPIKPGVFILEHPGNYSFTAHPRFQQLRKYGGVSFSFFS
jgi:16S rRNA G966 N2-methylase RsmD